MMELNRLNTSVNFVEGSIKAEPITLEEAKNFLRISLDYHDDDELINSLIIMARVEAENKTGGRVFPDSVWEIATTDGSVFPTMEPILIPISPFRDIYNPPATTEEEPASTEEEQPVVFTSIVPSSLTSNGRPIYGYVTLDEGVELTSFKIIAGWPNRQEEKVRRYDTAPELNYSAIRYESSKIYLQFDRKISGSADSNSFVIVVNGEQLLIDNITFDEDGRVVINIDSTSRQLENGDKLTMTYVSGFLHDKDGNYVLPIVRKVLPTVELLNFGEENDDDSLFVPVPLPMVDSVYYSLVPDILKKWMLVRIATVYQQRSEIAIQAGKTSNSFFPRGFIDGLLDPFNIEKA